MKLSIKNSLVKDSFIYGVGGAINKFIGLILIPIFSRYLSPSQFGILSLLAILTSIVIPVFNLGFSSSMGAVYFEKQDLDHRRRTLWTTFLSVLPSSLLLLAIGFFFAGNIAKIIGIGNGNFQLVWLTILNCIFSLMASPFLLALQFEKKSIMFVIVSLIVFVSTITANIILVVYLGMGAKGLVLGPMVGSALNFLILLALYLYKFPICFDRNIAKKLLNIGFPMMPSFLYLFLLMHANKYFLERFSGIELLGIYSLGFNLGFFINIVTSSFASSWFPFFIRYRDNQMEASILFGQVLTKYTIVVGTIILIAIIFSKPLVLLLFDTRYQLSYQSIGPAAIANFLLGYYNIFLPRFYFNDRVALQAKIQMVSALFSLPITIILIYFFGLTGANISLVLGHVILVILTLFWRIEDKSTHPRVQYEWKVIFKFIILFSFFYITANISHFNSILSSLIYSAILAIFSVFIVLHLVDNEELKKWGLLHNLLIFKRLFGKW